MKIFAFLALLFFTANPSPVPDRKSNTDETKSNGNSVTVVVEQGNQSTGKETDHSEKKTPKWDASVWANWALVAVGFLTFAAIIYQAVQMARATREMQASAEIAKKTLVLTQRPKIIVRMFYFSAPTGAGVGVNRVSSQIGSDPFCSGQFYIDNCGGTDAKIQEIYCTPYIAEKLPMKRPWEGKIGSQDKKTIRPGGSIPFLFGLPVSEPLEMQTLADITEFKTKNFYVLGWIGYTDALGIYRMTVFCRRYDLSTDRFVAVDDPDYEYAD